MTFLPFCRALQASLRVTELTLRTKIGFQNASVRKFLFA